MFRRSSLDPGADGEVVGHIEIGRVDIAGLAIEAERVGIEAGEVERIDPVGVDGRAMVPVARTVADHQTAALAEFPVRDQAVSRRGDGWLGNCHKTKKGRQTC